MRAVLFDELAVAGYLTHPGRNIQRYTGNGFAFDAAGSGPDQVDLEPFVELRVVGAVVAAACLAALECGLECGPRRDGAGLQVECVREVLEPGDVGVHAQIGHPLFDLRQLG